MEILSTSKLSFFLQIKKFEHIQAQPLHMVGPSSCKLKWKELKKVPVTKYGYERIRKSNKLLEGR